MDREIEKLIRESQSLVAHGLKIGAQTAALLRIATRLVQYSQAIRQQLWEPETNPRANRQQSGH
jgi:hypothetical protein